jgi:hypothetical protein
MLETVSFRGWRGGPGGDALDVQIYGASSDTLKAAAEALKTEVSQYPEVSGVEDNLAYDKEELVLDLTPQGQALGVTIDAAGPGAARPAERDRGRDLSRRAALRRDPGGTAGGRADGRFPRPGAGPRRPRRLRPARRHRDGRKPHRLLHRPARERHPPRLRDRRHLRGRSRAGDRDHDARCRRRSCRGSRSALASRRASRASPSRSAPSCRTRRRASSSASRAST